RSRSLPSPSLFDPCRLAGEAAEVIQARATHFATAHDFQTLDPWGIQQKRALDAHVVADPTHGKRRARPTAPLAQDHALELLQTLAAPLDDLDRDAHGVAGPKIREVGAHEFLLDALHQVHWCSPSSADNTKKNYIRGAALGQADGGSERSDLEGLAVRGDL